MRVTAQPGMCPEAWEGVADGDYQQSPEFTQHQQDTSLSALLRASCKSGQISYLEALEAPAALISLLLLPHGRPHIRVHHIRALHCLCGDGTFLIPGL